MTKNKKLVLIAAGLLLLLLSVKIIIDTPYRKGIPSIKNLNDLSDYQKSQLKKATNRAKAFPSATNIGELGMVYHSGAFYSEAMDCYALAIKKDKSDWIWNYYLGYLKREMGESEEAVAAFSEVISKNPKAYHAFYYMGQSLQDLSRYDEAEKAYRIIVSLQKKENRVPGTFRDDFFPLSVYVKYQLSQLYISNDRLGQAEDMLNEILTTHNSFGSAYRVMGALERLKGDTIAAARNLLKANDMIVFTYPVDTITDRISLISRSENYLLKQIDEAYNTSYTDWARTLINNALRYLPENKYVISKAVRIILSTESGDDALALLEKHQTLFNDEYEELKIVADLLFEKEFYKEAEPYYTRALELRPGESEIMANLVLGLYNQGKNIEAENLLSRQVSESVDDPEVIGNAVYIMLVMDQREKAIDNLRKMRTRFPDHPKMFMLSGLLAQQEEDLVHAGEFFESAFSRKPDDLLTIQSLGDVLMRQSQWKQAISLFRKGIEYFPNEPYILERLGSLLVACPDKSLRNYSEGRDYLERVVTHRNSPTPTMISAGRGLAEAYVGLGDKQRASMYMNYVINLARSSLAPERLIDELERKSKELGL